ncbi:MAG: class B sortase [Raoultibacter sp.]
MAEHLRYGQVLPASSRPAQQGRGMRPSVRMPQGGAPLPPKKNGPWRIVFGIAFIVLVLSLIGLGAIVFSYVEGQNTYKEIAQEAFVAPSDPAQLQLEQVGIDWDALRKKNPEVVGWIYVPETSVNYPVTHTSDNEKYLLTDFNGDTGYLAKFGTIFLSAENKPDFSDANNVVYGHHMNDGSMFGFIHKLFEESAFNEHRTMYLFTPDGNYKLSTFALIACKDDDPLAQTSFATPADLQAYVQDKIDRSAVSPSEALDPAGITRVFSLVTCDNVTDAGREVLFASVVESTKVEAAPNDAGVGKKQTNEKDAVNPNDARVVEPAAEEAA